MYIHLFSLNNLCYHIYIYICIIFDNCLYMSLVYLCVFSSVVYLYIMILMYVKHHEQFEIGCGAILNKYIIIIITK